MLYYRHTTRFAPPSGGKGSSVKIAYADPPYVGQARKHYSHDPDCAEVDHRDLATTVCEYDGWAVSASSPSLRLILPLFPEGTRVAAWVKPFASFKPGVNPAYAWEPVLFKPARSGGRDRATVRDWCSANITLKKGLSGAKPPVFCRWLFSLLGCEVGDEFHDLFPGTGIVSREWESWTQEEMFFDPAQRREGE